MAPRLLLFGLVACRRETVAPEPVPGCPAIALAPSTLAWEDLLLGIPAGQSVQVSNACATGDPLVGLAVTDGPAFAVVPGSFEVGPGEVVELTVAATLDDYDDVTGTLVVRTNDASRPVATAWLLASALQDQDGDGAPATEDCDDADASVVAARTGYADEDGDGYGDPATAFTACDLGSAVTEAGDCNDADAAVNPGAEEVCDADGVDEDCDGIVDPCRPYGTYDLGSFGRIVGVRAGDYVGTVVAGGADVDGDGYDDLLFGSGGYDGGGTDAGAAWLFYGPAPVAGSVTGADVTLVGEAEDDGAGSSAAFAGDVNADGYADLVVGAPGTDLGTVYVLFGPVEADASLGTADATILGTEGWMEVGSAVAGVGDLDGDGYDDLLVGDRRDDVDGAWSGSAYVVPGPPAEVERVEDLPGKLLGRNEGDEAGSSVAGAGDVDGDGLADLLVGAPYDDAGGQDAGTAYLVLGPPPSVTTSLAYFADAVLTGEDADDELTGDGGMRSAGDLDGDGYGDLLLGSASNGRGGEAAGTVYVVYGPVEGTLDMTLADAFVSGLGAGDHVGNAAGVGDLDGDGAADLLVGAPGHDLPGATYLLCGPVGGTVDLADAGATWTGEIARDEAGYPVAGGDIDGDAVPDFLVGAPEATVPPAGAGAVYLVYGGGL